MLNYIKMKHKNWILIAIFGAFLTAPNASVIKLVTSQVDPLYWNFCRFLLVAIITLPLVAAHRRQLLTRKVLLPIVLFSITMAAASICHAFAIFNSQASYVSLIYLIAPVTLIILSNLMLREPITKRSGLGITVSAIGALSLVVLPIAMTQGNFVFYPLATVLELTDCFLLSLAIIIIRKVDERSSVPLPAIIGLSAALITFINLIAFVLFGDSHRLPQDGTFWLAALYSGIGVLLVGRMLAVRVFEKLGAATSGGFAYFETFLAILVPVVILNERLSIAMVIGGILILVGVLVIENNRLTHLHLHLRRHRQ